MLKTFDVYSGKIRISDPCYGKNVVISDGKVPNVQIFKAKKGRWVVSVVKDERVYSDIISSLVACYDESLSKSAGIEDVSNDFHKALSMMMANQDKVFTTSEHSATVESGVLGIFDDKSYRDNKTATRATRFSDKIVCEDEPWYSICCDRVLSEDQWGVVPNGCVAPSSKEGEVSVSVQTNSYGEVVRVEVDFQAQVESEVESEDEDYEDYEEEEEICDCDACKSARGELKDGDEDEDGDS